MTRMKEGGGKKRIINLVKPLSSKEMYRKKRKNRKDEKVCLLLEEVVAVAAVGGMDGWRG